MRNLPKHDKNSVVNKLTSLDEAKQLILHLLDAQEKLHTVLNYEVRTPLMIIKGYAGLAQMDDTVQEYSYFKNTIIQNVERIERMIHFASYAALDEWYWHRNLLLEYYPTEFVNPSPILIEAASQIQRNVDFDNDLRVSHAEFSKRRGITPPTEKPINASFNIEKDLPLIQFNAGIFESVMSDVHWLLRWPYNDDITVSTTFDEQWVIITLGFSTNGSLQHVQEDFQQFETAQNSFKFYGETVPLYNIWNKIRAYGGEISLNIQDKINSGKRSKIEVTLNLKR
jgi:hypothetical protein